MKGINRREFFKVSLMAGASSLVAARLAAEGVDASAAVEAGAPDVTGGRLLVGPAGANALYVGVNQDVSEFTGQRNAPVIDVSNAHVENPSAAYNLVCKGLSLAHTPGAHTTVRVHDGGHFRAIDGHVYVGNYATESNPIPTTNFVEVTGSGSWMSFQHFYNDNKKNGMVTTFRIADGGTVEMRNFANSAKGELHLIVDGGV